MINFGQFAERAAIIEFDGGMSRFQAETAAAREQGKQRFEVLDAIKNRNAGRTRDSRKSVARSLRKNDMPKLQSAPEKET